MHARNSVRSVEKSLTLADSPYTVLPYIYNVIKVNTTGGNVRVNLPTVDYPIDVIKTSSDSYIVTIWVAGTQKATVAGPMSKITIENAEVTQDELWAPHDAIVGIAGISGDGGEIIAKDRYGRVIARGVAGIDDAAIIQAAIDTISSGICGIMPGVYYIKSPIIINNNLLSIEGCMYGSNHITGDVIFEQAANCDILHIYGTSITHIYGSTIRNICFRNPSARTYTGIAIHLKYVDMYNIVENVFSYINNEAILVECAYGGHVEKNSFFYIGNSADSKACVRIKSIDGFVTTDQHINKNTFEPSRYCDIYATDLKSSWICENWTEYISTYPLIGFIKIDGSSVHNHISHNHIEGSTSAAVSVTGIHVTSSSTGSICADIADNVIIGCGISVYISAHLCDIHDNFMSAPVVYGIYVDANKYFNDIHDNILRHPGRESGNAGILLGSRCSVHGNVIYGYDEEAICCLAGSHNDIYGNHLTAGASDPSLHPFVEYAESNFNWFHDNKIVELPDATHQSLILVGINTVVQQNIGFISPGEVRTASGSLTAGNANAIAFAWHNPELQDILIKKVTIRITTPGGTAGSLLDVGIADDATGTNRGTEFFNDVDLNAAAIVKSTVATPGTQTVEVFCQDSVSATDGWIVGQILVANAASLVGSYYIEYEGA